MSDLSELIRAERHALIELLEALPPGRWSTPSLCAGWTVQDVAAHLAWQPVQGLPAATASLVRHRLQVNRMIAGNAVRWSQRGRDAILAQLREDARRDVKPLGVPRASALADAVVHSLDVARPLGLPRAVHQPAFRRTAGFLLSSRWPLWVPLGGSPGSRVSGVRLVAEAAGWSHGSGPDVRASPETVLLLLAGRPVEPAELAGPGAPAVLGRMDR